MKSSVRMSVLCLLFAPLLALPVRTMGAPGSKPAGAANAAKGNMAGMDMGASAVTRAIAVLYPATGNQVAGTVIFQMTDQGMKITADVTGLTPGKHGFHVHEFGDCSSSDYASAGSHFMTAGETHGAPGSTSSHRGDMGNLEADAGGKAHLEWVDPEMSFTGANSILGRSVIVHEKEDDLKSQPSGNAGARIACGVIGVAKP